MIAQSSSFDNGSIKQSDNTNKNDKKKKEHIPKYNLSHMIIPIEDMNWSLTQSPTVHRLWSECWKSDPYGSRYMPLNTSLKGDNLRKAKKILKDSGLFNFEMKMIVIGDKQEYETYVINYHGSRSSYWKLQNQTENPDSRTNNLGSQTEKRTPRTDNPGVQPESLTHSTFQNPSVLSQKHLSNSSKEVLRCGENISASSGENEISGKCPGMPLKPGEISNTPSLDDQGLLRWLRAAETGMIPPQEVIDQFRESGKYWPAFVACSRKHNWDLKASSTSITSVSSILEQLKQAQKSRQ